MEVQLEALIEQIKKDGVAAAEAEAAAIIEAAKKEACEIVADAEDRAEKILTAARGETERMTKSSEDAIKQAGRNLLLSFRESVAKELRAITKKGVFEAYSSDKTASLIVSVIESWAKKPDTESLTLILNSEDLSALENAILAGLKEKMLSGVTLRANDSFNGGFRIAVNDEGAYYDYSAEAVINMLSNYLSQRVTELLKEAE